MDGLDAAAGIVLPLLAGWILLSGVDDLLVAVAWIYASARGRPRIVPPGDPRLDVPERCIAVFLPLWREEKVILRMLECNLGAIRYGAYHVFAGAYPNDEPTVGVLRKCERRFPRLHVTLCPHPGPTSKADCLNWIWRNMLSWEREQGVRFDIVVVHDAEDVVHPDELRWANYYSRGFAMVQVPVLPLATPAGQVTHGVYCDEFAEYQTKDVPARQALGGFVPSNGVGTAYARRALERVAAGGRPFDDSCLTEDYDTGYRLRKLGFRQLFIPIHLRDGVPVATREYFPLRARDALRQRTRWVIGIALQGWERHGWGGGWRDAYWFWRDRKGLIGSPASLLANAVVVWIAIAWSFGGSVPPGTPWFTATLALQCFGLAFRIFCTGRIYGWAFAAGAPVRAFWANGLNACATACAVARYASARARHAPLAWTKTSHVYPDGAAAAPVGPGVQASS